jgi:3-hydroxybutyryl-CoA dehydratase
VTHERRRAKARVRPPGGGAAAHAASVGGPYKPLPFAVGEHVARRVRFDVQGIRNFATLCGDMNPLHHDKKLAAAGPFGTLIASGPHVVALMLGLDATFLSARGESLGLGFEFRFVKAVRAGQELTLEWTITSCRRTANSSGHIVSVEGRAVDDRGTVFVEGRGDNLIRPRKAK